MSGWLRCPRCVDQPGFRREQRLGEQGADGRVGDPLGRQLRAVPLRIAALVIALTSPGTVRADRRVRRTMRRGPRCCAPPAATDPLAAQRYRGLPERPPTRRGVVAPCVRLGAQADRRHAGDRRQRRPAVGQRRRLVQVRDTLLGDDMADVVAVDHHRRDRHAGILADLDGVERFDERRDPALLECLRDLHHQFSTAQRGRLPVREAQPRGGRVPATVRVVSHVRGAAEPGQPAVGDGRRVGVSIDLQRRPDEHVDCVLAGELTQHPVGSQRSVPSGEEHVGPGRGVTLHPGFAAEAVDRFHPADSIAGISVGCGFSVQCLAILPFKPSWAP